MLWWKGNVTQSHMTSSHTVIQYTVEVRIALFSHREEGKKATKKSCSVTAFPYTTTPFRKNKPFGTEWTVVGLLCGGGILSEAALTMSIKNLSKRF